MTRTWMCFLLASPMLFLVCGCDASTTPAPPLAPAVATPSAPVDLKIEAHTTDTTDSAVNLEIKSWDETLALVAEHKGKIVVLDLWSTSCEPCLVEFPNLVALHAKYGEEKLVCLSVSCDYIGLKSKPPESYVAKVSEFLTKQKATFQNVLLSVDVDELFGKIELASNPAVFVFGPDGQLAKRFDNDLAKKDEEFTYQKDVIPFVEKLLAE